MLMDSLFAVLSLLYDSLAGFFDRAFHTGSMDICPGQLEKTSTRSLLFGLLRAHRPNCREGR
jgi:hypothetical protein